MKKITKLENYIDSVMTDTSLPAGQQSAFLTIGGSDSEDKTNEKM